MSPLRVLPPTTLALVAALGLWAATDGLRAFTSEAARRIDLVESRHALPDVRLRTHSGDIVSLHGLRGRSLVLDFVYTRCPTLCTTLGVTQRRVQQRFADDIAAGRVLLLSISFDPTQDDPRALRAYLDRFTRDRTGWIAAAPADETELRHLLRDLQITVIPDGAGGWVHNDAVHVVDQAGSLSAILDVEDVEGIVRAVGQTL